MALDLIFNDHNNKDQDKSNGVDGQYVLRIHRHFIAGTEGFEPTYTGGEEHLRHQVNPYSHPEGKRLGDDTICTQCSEQDKLEVIGNFYDAQIKAAVIQHHDFVHH